MWALGGTARFGWDKTGPHTLWDPDEIGAGPGRQFLVSAGGLVASLLLWLAVLRWGTVEAALGTAPWFLVNAIPLIPVSDGYKVIARGLAWIRTRQW